eukprot:scaffold495631_cov39-Prasinocladus_malaysianus.AAC.1
MAPRAALKKSGVILRGGSPAPTLRRCWSPGSEIALKGCRSRAQYNTSARSAVGVKTPSSAAAEAAVALVDRARLLEVTGSACCAAPDDCPEEASVPPSLNL